MAIKTFQCARYSLVSAIRLITVGPEEKLLK